MRVLSILLFGTITLSACGSAPTAPTAASSPAQQTVVNDPTGPPAPVPTPDPTPDPSPTPAPAPSPPPTPAPPSDTWQGTASTTDARWSEPAPIPESFKVKWDRETLTFGSLTAPVLIWDMKGTALGVFARPNGMNVQIVFDTATGQGTWTLSGLPGQATGSVTATR